MPYVSFISAPGCLATAAGIVTPLQTSTVHLKTGLATCGPERVGTGATPMQ